MENLIVKCYDLLYNIGIFLGIIFDWLSPFFFRTDDHSPTIRGIIVMIIISLLLIGLMFFISDLFKSGHPIYACLLIIFIIPILIIELWYLVTFILWIAVMAFILFLFAMFICD